MAQARALGQRGTKPGITHILIVTGETARFTLHLPGTGPRRRGRAARFAAPAGRTGKTGVMRFLEEHYGGRFVSIIRIGLAETKNFAEGYDAIFGKKKAAKKPEAKEPEPEAAKKAAKKPAKKS